MTIEKLSPDKITYVTDIISNLSYIVYDVFTKKLTTSDETTLKNIISYIKDIAGKSNDTDSIAIAIAQISSISSASTNPEVNKAAAEAIKKITSAEQPPTTT